MASSYYLSLIVTYVFYGLSIGKVYELYHRDHFHDEMQDVPKGMRYAAAIAFYNDTKTCNAAKDALPFTDNKLPSVDHLFLGQYEFSTSRDRVWYNYVDHLDLPKYLGVEEYMNSKEQCECPIIVFLPASYADDIEDDYLRNPTLDGVKIWNSEEESDWKIWTWKNLEKKLKIYMDIPYDFEITVNHQTINTYLQQQGKKWTKTYKVNALLSHAEITVFPGDTFYISSDPELPAPLKRARKKTQKAKKPTPSAMNPVYTAHSNMNVLNVVQFDDDTW
eukprot:CAMPEP_0201568492 /NCGR_PEP_ID=MMETSP0190_2-20130828/9603_1 /ASSEMBLY_ACC=CAM_ASM_000263 /TAXON_ID=37353 /ORGANISM="Rosalina sp." /LENGTH=276 /DNA_ID=CAMNT_0047989669 /DNA_START=28 /DNA_END=855 /DNA_ORIENTATION=-